MQSKRGWCLLVLTLAFMLSSCAFGGIRQSEQPLPKEQDTTKVQLGQKSSQNTERPPTDGKPAQNQTDQPHAIPKGKVNRVVVVVEENSPYERIIGNPEAPYINQLAKQGALFTDSHGVTHPSQPNYLMLFSGSNQGITNDACIKSTFSTPNLGSELIQAGLTFDGYSEGLPAVGSTKCSKGNYAKKHNPWANFSNIPLKDNMPFSSFPDDFGTLPTVSFVIPNLQNDMHDGSPAQGDTWLKTHLDAYVRWAKNNNSLLILTWDEDDFKKANHIPTIFIGPMIKPGVYNQTINHYHVLRTIQDLYDLPHTGKSGTVQPIAGIWRNKSD